MPLGTDLEEKKYQMANYIWTSSFATVKIVVTKIGNRLIIQQHVIGQKSKNNIYSYNRILSNHLNIINSIHILKF